MLDTIVPLLPKSFSAYCEPFVGGGALLFYLQPQTAFVNDINEDLIRVYRVIQTDVQALVAVLRGFQNDAASFYSVRAWDRDKAGYALLPDIEKAARIIYLNKTCYNGLFRVNSAGEFNAPFGRYAKPNIVNAPALMAASEYFNTAAVCFSSRCYSEVLAALPKDLPKDTFVYLDPPYDPVSGTANFTAYSKAGFSRDDQIALRNHCDELHARGLKFMLSNSATDFIKGLYAGYNITLVQAKRAINSNGANRGGVSEVLVRNYG
ncbi:MAG: DNA adenine methylase [Spirochaetes bacterium]|nr:DNA adenine methylase [Spirochaetota bacterium]